jgi:hypothetical protein
MSDGNRFSGFERAGVGLKREKPLKRLLARGGAETPR